MRVSRFFTKEGTDPHDYVKWKKIDVKLKDETTGKVIYEFHDVTVPEKFSGISSNIIVGKYFKITNVPKETTSVDEKNIKGIQFPAWLRRSVSKEESQLGAETHAMQVFRRLAGFWTYWGWMYNYFDEESDALAFFDESIFMLANQMAAPNTPQWFGSGIYWAYGMKGEPKGFWRVDPITGEVSQTKSFYEFPGVHACHILGVSDHLFGPDGDGIYDNLNIETRAFAQGGGAGSNFSSIRSKYEKMSSGSYATGLMSFLKVFDRSAGVIKSGSGQRRSSKMVILNMDHPEIEEFIEWKMKEEEKVDALIKSGYDSHYEGEAYRTISGQNSNNSVRVSNAFIEVLKKDGGWNLVARTNGEVVKEVKAKDIWNKIIKSAWRTGDPGVQFDDMHNDWNTCAADGRLVATNPCQEFSFITNTSCNLASLNLQAFCEPKSQDICLNVDAFNYACRHWLMVLDISNQAAQLPSRTIAIGTHNYRATGLGHTGIGAVLMQAGIPYGSDKACHMTAAITSLMTANAYYRSAELACRLGPFPRWTINRDNMLRVLENHFNVTCGRESGTKPVGLSTGWWCLDKQAVQANIYDAAVRIWRETLEAGKQHGFRNAFVTLIAPSGTIGLLLGCDTLAIEPDYSIVKFKKLSGGGTMKIVNESLRRALINLGYDDTQTSEILKYVLGHNTLDGAPHINKKFLIDAGIAVDDVDKFGKEITGSTELRFVIAPHTISDESKHVIGLDSSDKNIFKRLGVSKEEYITANLWICGHGTLEGAPHLKAEHLPVFDCANRSGIGGRFIKSESHINMMAAVSPLISGAISKTINLPNNATEADIDKIYRMSHALGIKGIALYRDGCKRSQPLNSGMDMSWWDGQANKPDGVYLRGQRKRPPKKRLGITQEFTIQSVNGEHKVWITTGEYENGKLCEVWIDISKENPEFRQAMRWWARAVSNAIQYGQPLDELAASFVLEEGGPSGKTDHPYITYCKSVPDLVLKFLATEYLGDTNWCRRKPPLSELRCSQHMELLKGVGEIKKAKKHVVGAAVLTVQQDHITKCPICGSTNIIQYPCVICASCGASLSGCSP